MHDREELNNPHYNDCYFSYDEGFEEAAYVFVDGNNIPHCLKSKTSVTIGETGFGTGLNLMTLLQSLPSELDIDVTFLSVEKYPLTLDRMQELIGGSISNITKEAKIVFDFWKEQFDNTSKGWISGSFVYKTARVKVMIYIGDVADFMANLDKKVDIWFLDGHSPDKNPAMWAPELMQEVGNHSRVGTTIATFSAAGLVKEGLRQAGFFIKRRKGFGGKRHMIQGVYKGDTSDTTQ